MARLSRAAGPHWSSARDAWGIGLVRILEVVKVGISVVVKYKFIRGVCESI